MSLLARRRGLMSMGAKGPLTYIGSVELTAASNAVEFLVPEEHQNDKMFLVDATLIIPNDRSIYICPQLNSSTSKSYMASISKGTIHHVFYIVPAPTWTNKGLVFRSTSRTDVIGGAIPLTAIRFAQYYTDGNFGAGSKLTVYSADLESYL